MCKVSFFDDYRKFLLRFPPVWDGYMRIRIYFRLYAKRNIFQIIFENAYILDYMQNCIYLPVK